MSDRVSDRLRRHFATLQVPQRPEFAVPQRKRLAWLTPIAAAAAVLAVLALAGLRPWESSGLHTADGRPRPSLPDELASYAYSTASVTQSPPGTAIALYQHGYGVELADIPQALVVGAFRDVYRQVDAAYDRADPADQADPAPFLLSPDGRKVAVGSHRGLGDLALVDLATGRQDLRKAEPGSAIRPLAWSADGRYIAVLKLAEAADNQTPTEKVAIFDLTPAAGAPGFWETATSGTRAAFSPDGKELVIESTSSIFITDLTGRTLRTLHPATASLASRSAWSPDGRWIGMIFGDELRFLDATGGGAEGPAPVPGAVSMLGWAGDHRVIVRSGATVREVDLETRRERDLTRTNGWPGDNFMTAEIQLATGLITDLGVRDDAWLPDRGPWPAGYRAVSVLAAVGFVLLLIAWRLTRRLRRSR